MPAQILHTLFGEDALTSSGSSPLNPATLEGALFSLGCQGPDLFYHNQRTRPVSIEYGTLLHRRGYGRFVSALLWRCAEADAAPFGPRIAYALGFLTHAYLDRALHPYIVYKAGWVAPSKPETARYARCHAFFERVIDTLMLMKIRGLDVSSWPQLELLVTPCEAAIANRGLLIDALASALRDAYPERAASDERLEARLGSAFQDAAGFYAFTDPGASVDSLRFDQLPAEPPARRRAALALLHPLQLGESMDYLNLEHRTWHHPCNGQPDTRSVPELYVTALASAAPGLRAAFEYLSQHPRPDSPSDEVASLVGGATLSIGNDDGKPCAPTLMDPFALDSVLDEQFVLRCPHP